MAYRVAAILAVLCCMAAGWAADRHFLVSDGNIYVPVRSIAEAIGATYTDDGKGEIKIADADRVYMSHSGGKLADMRTASAWPGGGQYDGMWYMPLSNVLPTFRLSVTWDNAKRTFTLTHPRMKEPLVFTPGEHFFMLGNRVAMSLKALLEAIQANDADRVKALAGQEICPVYNSPLVPVYHSPGLPPPAPAMCWPSC